MEDWLSPRAYVGLLLTSVDTSSCGGFSPCDVSAKIGFAGAKVRFTAPIPYVAPFVEIGLGASAGRLTTRTASRDQSYAGVTYHIPFAIGLALGRDHTVEVALASLYHHDQDEGAATISLAFPLR